MDKNLIEKYKSEMLNMYKRGKTAPAMAETPVLKPKTEPTNMSFNEPLNIPQTPTVTEIEPVPEMLSDSTGELIAIVTSLRNIYPLKGAKVTVFTGNYYDNMDILDTAFTDESGRTKAFILPTPAKALSETSGASEKPYSSYNMLVESDGYIDNIHLNIPVFSGVVSLQGSDMMLRETAGENKGPRIFDEGQEFTL